MQQEIFRSWFLLQQKSGTSITSDEMQLPSNYIPDFQSNNNNKFCVIFFAQIQVKNYILQTQRPIFYMLNFFLMSQELTKYRKYGVRILINADYLVIPEFPILFPTLDTFAKNILFGIERDGQLSKHTIRFPFHSIQNST